MYKYAGNEPRAFAGTDDRYSYWNTINPFSGIMGGGDRYPKFWAAMFPDNPGLAHLTFKAGACALLAAGLVGGYRALKHVDKVSDMAEEDNPGKELSSQLSTTFEGTLSSKDMSPAKKALKEQQKKQQQKTAADSGVKDPTDVDIRAFSANNFLGMAVPVGATLLAACLAYKGVDDLVGARRNKLLDETIAEKDNALKKMMQTRARIAKGTATQKEVNSAIGVPDDDNIFMKTAGDGSSITQKGVTGVGLLVMSLVGASALGAYEYFKSSNENNIRYKAIKKGLKEYAKGKTNITPITVVPSDADKYFETIDTSSQDKPMTIRDQIEVNPDELKTPISVTL